MGFPHHFELKGQDIFPGCPVLTIVLKWRDITTCENQVLLYKKTLYGSAGTSNDRRLVSICFGGLDRNVEKCITLNKFLKNASYIILKRKDI